MHQVQLLEIPHAFRQLLPCGNVAVTVPVAVAVARPLRQCGAFWPLWQCGALAKGGKSCEKIFFAALTISVGCSHEPKLECILYILEGENPR